MSQEQQAPEPPDYEPFLRLGDLIFRARVMPGTLATAIEQNGIQTWDRFGRLKLFHIDSPEAQKALDYLAMVYDSWGQPPDERMDHEEFYERGGDAYGWQADRAPDFDLITAGQSQKVEPSRPERPNPKNETSNLAIILALLRFIKGEMGNRPHPEYISETQLIEYLVPRMVEFTGTSGRNLKDKFARAKELIPKSEQ